MTTMNKEAGRPESASAPDATSPNGGREKNGEGAPPTPPRKKQILITVLIVFAVVAIIFAIFSWLNSRQFEATDDAFIDGHVVTISPQVQAVVLAVHVDDNSIVKKGDVLVELDPRDFQAALEQAQGNLAADEGKLKEAESQEAVSQANIGEAEAELAVAQTNADNSNQDLQRWLALDERARSKQELDNATAAQKSTAAQVMDAKAKVTSMQAQALYAQMAYLTAQGDLKSAQGALDQAKNNLDYCTIRADSDGVITRKSVEPGMLVEVNQALFSIVPTDVWVTANFKETQLNNIFPGQEVTIDVDAYPGRTLHGKVESVQNGTGARFSLLPPENATGNYVKVVQRVPVKIVLDPGENDDMQHLLAPGMSVEPQVKVR
jgi:membrane fusion protein, multidrug efflux system